MSKTCIYLQGPERKGLLTDVQQKNAVSDLAEDSKRIWLQTDDEDLWVLSAITGKVGELGGGGSNVMRLHAPPMHNLREVVPDKKLAKAQPVATGVDWGVIVEDLIDLEEEGLNEAPVLHNLRLRYHDEEAIFTALGDVLIAVNPFCAVPSCSDKAIANMMLADVESLPPHICKVAREAYAGMTEMGYGQAILVSGESGAGKTESAKLALKCIALASNSTGAVIDAALASNPVLEAFGNATTIHNKNSSRFGKWMMVYFDERHRIAACHMRSFLLEQARACSPPPAERNFHVFHMLIAAGADALPAGLPADSAAYEYTRLKPRVDGVDKDPPRYTAAEDARLWKELIACMGTLDITDGQIKDICRLLGALLSLGNCGFKDPPKGTKAQVADANSEKALAAAASLLQVEQSKLLSAITTRTMMVNNEKMTLEHNQAQSIDSRDALTKATYSALFLWIVGKVNVALSTKHNKSGVAFDDERAVGLLDIFGFENFRLNSLEQLCINLTNERLQYIFIDALVKRQLAEYKREQIEYAHIVYPDNSAQLTLIDGKSGSVMSLLDEECRVPNGQEANYVSKMHTKFAGNSLYSEPRRGAAAVGAEFEDQSLDRVQFVIEHYAGPVRYTALNWLDKNRGVVPTELCALMAGSQCPLAATLYPSSEHASPLGGISNTASRVTVGAAFRKSLLELSATILQLQHHFIRCIKPNPDQAPMRFDGRYINKQLAHAGIKSVVEINLRGYPVSFVHAEFVRRYRVLGFHKPKLIAVDSLGPKTVSANLLAIAEDEHDADAARQARRAKRPAPAPIGWAKAKEHQTGLTKVFMRGHVRRQLEKQRTVAFTRAAKFVQKRARLRIIARVEKLLAPMLPLAEAAREHIVKRDPQPAADALDELSRQWALGDVPPSLHPSLGLMRADLDELEHMLRALQKGIAEETAALKALRERLDDPASSAPKPSRDVFVAMKRALGQAKAVSKGWTDDLKPAIVEADALLQKAFSSIIEQWEAELAAQKRAADEARMKKLADAEQKLRTDPAYEVLLIPMGGVRGVQVNDLNTVIRIEANGAPRGALRLRVGDVILDVAHTPLKGENAAVVIEAAAGEPVAVARSKAQQGGGDTLPTGDHAGWLYASLALNKGDQLLGGQGAHRFWAALRADKLLLVPPRAGDSARLPDVGAHLSRGGSSAANKAAAAAASPRGSGKNLFASMFKRGGSSTNNVAPPGGGAEEADGHFLLGTNNAETGEREIVLAGAQAKPLMTTKLTLKSTTNLNSTEIALPAAAKALADRKLAPFRVSWLNGETEGIELFCAAATAGERKEWVETLNRAIRLHQIDHGTSGWLLKRGGRTHGPDTGWKRRWFSLAVSAANPHERTLAYAEAPNAASAKGTILIDKHTVLLPLQGHNFKDQEYCFTISTLEAPPPSKAGAAPAGEKRRITTTLAASSADELDKWSRAVDDAVRACVYADYNLSVRTPQMRRDEVDLMSKTVPALHGLLDYLNEKDYKHITDKGVLAARIVAARFLSTAGKGRAALMKADRERSERAKREQARLMNKSVEELHQLLVYMDVEGVDPEITDKEQLVQLIVAEKQAVRAAKKHEPELRAWQVRASATSMSRRESAVEAS